MKFITLLVSITMIISIVLAAKPKVTKGKKHAAKKSRASEEMTFCFLYGKTTCAYHAGCKFTTTCVGK